MDQKDRSYSIAVDRDNREVHFAIAGFWDLDSMKAFLAEMNEQAAPLVNSGRTFNALADMRDVVPQARDVVDCYSRHLAASKEHGLRRVALVQPPILVKSQYRRAAGDLDVEFFDDKASAIAWLRS